MATGNQQKHLFLSFPTTVRGVNSSLEELIKIKVILILF